MKVEKHLDWFPSFKNQIDITTGKFEITLKNGDVEILCDWDYGYGGRGSEWTSIPLVELKALIKELEDSENDGVSDGVSDGVNEAQNR